jgi:hypothetical protein
MWLTGYSWQDNDPPGSSTVSHPALQGRWWHRHICRPDHGRSAWAGRAISQRAWATIATDL